MNNRLANLLVALSTTKLACTPRDLADAVWLTLRSCPQVAGPAPSDQPEKQLKDDLSEFDLDTISNEPFEPLESAHSAAPPDVAVAISARKPPANVSPKAESTGVYLSQSTVAGRENLLGSRPFRSPAAAALPQSLAIARALRPLQRRVPSKDRFVLDESLTVRRILEEGLWLPALRPAPDRWLDVSLVVDEGSSMGIWRKAATELRKVLEWVGAFRSLRIWGMNTDSSPPSLHAGPGKQTRNPLELVDPGGRSLILVLTDCVSDSWQDGSAARLVETWSRRGPVALLQALPEHFWMRTALGSGTALRMHSNSPAAPNTKLICNSLHARPTVLPNSGAALPTLPLEPLAIANWARMTAGISTGWAPGFSLNLRSPDFHELDELEGESSPEQLLDQFRQVASPFARKLAALLATMPVVNLPIIRTIRSSLLADAGQVHEAEVLLSGLLEHAKDDDESVEVGFSNSGGRDPEEIAYAFPSTVRELLLDETNGDEVLDVLKRMSSYIQEHIGATHSFAALLADPSSAIRTIDPNRSPFAHVIAGVLRRLGGDYARTLTSEHEPVLDDLTSKLSGTQSNVSLSREMKLFVEDLCCDLSRFRHAAEDGTPFDQITIDREYYLGTPGNYADIRVVPKVGDPYFMEVKLGAPNFGIVDNIIIQKYSLKPLRFGRASRLIIVIEKDQQAEWNQERERIKASIDPSLQLTVWDEDILTEQVKKYMCVEIPPISCETAHTIFLAIERAKASQAFGAHPNVEFHVEPVQSNLLWNFPFWTLKSLTQNGGNDPRNLYPRGKCEQVAIVVADLCGFSGFVRDTPSGELVQDMLTAFYTRSRYQIHNHGGMLYQFVGVQVVSFFGIPKASPDYLRSALHAARALVHIGRSLTSHWQRQIDREQPTGGVRVGITLGSLEIVPLRPFGRSTCGAIGDSFNVAARLLSAAESDEIVVSNSFYGQLDLPSKRLFNQLEPIVGKNVGNFTAWKLAAAT